MDKERIILADSINSAKSTQIALNALRFGEALLLQGKYELVAHSHPDVELTASKEDRDFLIKIGQNSSMIISWYTGNILKFYADPFEDLYN